MRIEKCYNQKLKVLETIARETSRQIHAQCRDRGELIDAVLERYRDVIDAKDQEIEEARLQNRRLIAMVRFCKHTIRTRWRGKKIALAKSLAATRREQKRVQVLNEKISSEFAHAKLRWQEISTERKNRRDLEREALIKSAKGVKTAERDYVSRDSSADDGFREETSTRIRQSRRFERIAEVCGRTVAPGFSEISKRKAD